jgi:type III restriction enzyme
VYSPFLLSDSQILSNIQKVQRKNDLHESEKLERIKGMNSGINLTIEMETGTGKTYTYIRTMYELQAHYGWSKYIVIVPSIAIREGVLKSFEMTQEHFLEIYGHKIVPFIYNSSRPQDIVNFATDSRISVMIINTQAFNARGEDARRIYQELDQFNTRKPIEMIAETNPILIIDEPQSVDGDKTLKSMQDFHPLFSIRYSATHKIDYNQVFRLDALDAYNKKLVKKIQVKGISLKGSTGTTGYLYLEQISLSTTKPPFAILEIEKRAKDHITKTRLKVSEGANLYDLSGNLPVYKNHVVTEINGYLNKIVVNGQDIFPGEILNDKDENTFRRIQIRETIQSHIQKEKQLFSKGIKVLSLFFIDSVEKYRIYTESGDETLGEYAKIFEEEYTNVVNEHLSLFEQEYNQYMIDTEPGKVKAYLPDDYSRYLKRDEANSVHNGYFSIDKKNKLTNPSTKRGSDDSDDISAFDLIMKDKERLLSFEEPTRFIFSHSALKEGWDNPNVFQICALKNPETGSATRRRQEVGRGMRLCVNKNGNRLDYEVLSDEVHSVNKLTIVASESYENFAKGLQSEIVEILKNRPNKAEVEYFTGRIVTNEKGEEYRLTPEDAKKINKVLYKNDLIDDADRLTESGRASVDKGIVPLPEELVPYKESIVKHLKAIITGEMFLAVDERKTITTVRNNNFNKKEFQELWNRIKFKSIYEVKFDTEKLIGESILRIDQGLYVSKRKYEVKTGEMDSNQDSQAREKISRHELFSESVDGTKTKDVNSEILSESAYDIIGEIEKITYLLRRTIVTILKGIKKDKFALFRVNPEEFILRTGKLINEAKASLIYNNIKYHRVEDFYDSNTIFTNDTNALRNDVVLKKHIYDYITSDSTIEKKFAESLESNASVIVYAKLPRNFKIFTPIENYSPDWAIVLDKDNTRQIYFVAETKGSTEEKDLREIEKLKIHCAREHFQAISGTDIKFDVVKDFQKLTEIIQGL